MRKLINTPNTVAFATIEISVNNVKSIVRIIVKNTEIIGVLCFSDTLHRDSGRALSLAIPYIIREVTINIIKTVLAVAKSAINDIIKPPTGPKAAVVTALKGSGDAAISE